MNDIRSGGLNSAIHKVFTGYSQTELQAMRYQARAMAPGEPREFMIGLLYAAGHYGNLEIQSLFADTKARVA